MFNVKSFFPGKPLSRPAAQTRPAQEPRRLAPSARQIAVEHLAPSFRGSASSSPSLPTPAHVLAGAAAPSARQQVLAKVQTRMERHNEAAREEREGPARQVAGLFVIDEETGRDVEIDALPALHERVGQAVLQALGEGHGHAGDLSARTLAAARTTADEEGLEPHELTEADLDNALTEVMTQRRVELRSRLPYDLEEREAELVERLTPVARDEFALTGERLEAVLENAFRRAWQACDDLACTPCGLSAGTIEAAVSSARRASLSLEIQQAQEAQPVIIG